MSDTVRKVDDVPASSAVIPLLEVRDLKMHFPIKEAAGLARTKKVVQAVDGVNFDLKAPVWVWSVSPVVASRPPAG
jgi:ABC-type glutathione transport system ATPase component